VNYLTADECLCDRLFGILEPIEIRDGNGKVLGHYTPVVTAEELAAYKKAQGLFDLAAIKQRKEAERGQGKTTAEVLESLHALEKRV